MPIPIESVRPVSLCGSGLLTGFSCRHSSFIGGSIGQAFPRESISRSALSGHARWLASRIRESPSVVRHVMAVRIRCASRACRAGLQSAFAPVTRKRISTQSGSCLLSGQRQIEADAGFSPISPAAQEITPRQGRSTRIHPHREAWDGGHQNGARDRVPDLPAADSFLASPCRGTGTCRCRGCRRDPFPTYLQRHVAGLRSSFRHASGV